MNKHPNLTLRAIKPCHLLCCATCKYQPAMTTPHARTHAPGVLCPAPNVTNCQPLGHSSRSLRRRLPIMRRTHIIIPTLIDEYIFAQHRNDRSRQRSSQWTQLRCCITVNHLSRGYVVAETMPEMFHHLCHIHILAGSECLFQTTRNAQELTRNLNQQIHKFKIASMTL